MKTYQTKGLIRLTLSLNVGGEEKRIPFVHGTTFNDSIIGATYSTTDVAEQEAIENCKKYQDGFIFLKSETNSNAPIVKVFKNITTSAQAVSKLSTLGFTDEQLAGSASDIVKLAKENNISFPDWQTFKNM